MARFVARWRWKRQTCNGWCSACATTKTRWAVPVPQLHLARSCAKKAIRALVRVEQEGHAIPDVLPRICNAMCNLFFLMTLVVNRRRGLDEVPFASKSYKV